MKFENEQIDLDLELTGMWDGETKIFTKKNIGIAFCNDAITYIMKKVEEDKGNTENGISSVPAAQTYAACIAYVYPEIDTEWLHTQIHPTTMRQIFEWMVKQLQGKQAQ